MTRSPFIPKFTALPRELPIFPLSGAVVMPSVQLPLNIFEPRYLNMVADALATDHLIGMIQPVDNSDADEAQKVRRVGCAGRVTSYSETNDGRVILVLTGVCRFDVLEELQMQRGYRRVKPGWDRYALDYQLEEEDIRDRDAFLTSLRAYTQLRGVQVPWDDMKDLPDLDLVNLLCAHLPLAPNDKQALIETLDLGGRAELMRSLMDMSSVSSVATAGHRH